MKLFELHYKRYIFVYFEPNFIFILINVSLLCLFTKFYGHFYYQGIKAADIDPVWTSSGQKRQLGEHIKCKHKTDITSLKQFYNYMDFWDALAFSVLWLTPALLLLSPSELKRNALQFLFSETLSTL